MKKIIMCLAVAAVLAFTLAFAVSAESVHSGKVDLSATVTLDDGTVCELFDGDGNALIWYATGEKVDGVSVYSSIRADDERVKYKATYGFNVGNNEVGKKYAYEVSEMWIDLESGKVSGGNIVVLNLMDDDVVVNTPNGTNEAYMGGVVNCLKNVMWANKIIEYAFVRLDTVALQANAFSGCPKLKYVNLSELTELRQIESGTFNSCSALFRGEVLDLSATKLYKIGGTSCLANTKIAGYKLPNTLVEVGQYCFEKNDTLVEIAFPYRATSLYNAQFNQCTALKVLYMSKNTTTIQQNVFNNCKGLEKVFFVGTKAEFEGILASVNTTGNDAFISVAQNLISYSDYLALEDKSGKYVVYDYSYCEAYENGEHQLTGSVEMQTNIDFFKEIVFLDACTVCGAGAVDETLTIDALFVSMGISAKTFGTDIGLVQGYQVNKTAIEAYKAYVSDFDFGILAYANVGGEAVAPRPGDDKVVDIVFDNAANSYIEVKVTGIPADFLNAPIVFCIYATEGEKFYYLDNGNTTETIVGSSYNEILG